MTHDSKTDRYTYGPLVIIAFGTAMALLLVAFDLVPGIAPFYLEETETVGQALLGLFVAALFMERVLEVFITAWRQRERGELDHALKSAERAHADALSKLEASDNPSDALRSAVVEARETIDQTDAPLRAYKRQTQRYALAFGFAVGLLFALVGVRALSETVSYENLTGIQYFLFQVFDLLLTAGIIAGGSDAIHRLVSIFTDGFDATRARIKASASASDSSV